MNRHQLRRVMKWALKIQEKDNEGKMAQARKIAALAKHDSKGAADAESTLKQVTSYQAIYGRFIAEELLRPGAEADTEIEAESNPIASAQEQSSEEEWLADDLRKLQITPHTRILHQMGILPIPCMEPPLSQVERLIKKIKTDRLSEMCTGCWRPVANCSCYHKDDAS